MLEALQVLLPPLQEQRKIAGIIASVDDAIDMARAVIDQLGVVKSAMMADMLTRGLPGRHMRFKHRPLARCLEAWEVVTLGAITHESAFRPALPRDPVQHVGQLRHPAHD